MTPGEILSRVRLVPSTESSTGDLCHAPQLVRARAGIVPARLVRPLGPPGPLAHWHGLAGETPETGLEPAGEDDWDAPGGGQARTRAEIPSSSS